MAIKIRDGGAWVDVGGGDGDGIVPSGGIIMWSGAVSAIPPGWVLCDGNNSTPDLRSRFVVGATGDGSNNVTFDANTGAVSSNYSVGATGGSVAHQLTIAEMPSHNHADNYNVNSPGQDQAGSGSGDNDLNGITTTGNRGGDDFHENRPPYYALAFIMKT
jgi:microcystin-dependent protein